MSGPINIPRRPSDPTHDHDPEFAPADGLGPLSDRGLRLDRNEEFPESEGWLPEDAATFLRVRSMTVQDLRMTARWHLDLLPRAHPSSLGARFIRRWHLSHLDSPHAVALIAELTDVLPAQPVAFLIGSTDQRAHAEHVSSHHRLALRARGVAGLLTSPEALWRLAKPSLGRHVQRLTKLPTSGGRASAGAPAPRSAGPADSNTATPTAPVAVITAVAVRAHMRRNGIGRRLVETFEREAAHRGAHQGEVVTKWASAAEAFYDQCGWSRMPVRTDRDGAFVSPFCRDLAHLARQEEVTRTASSSELAAPGLAGSHVGDLTVPERSAG